jgi:hypothetical protein
MSELKSQLGQFMTTNADYILQGFVIPETVSCVLEPFAGNGDLIDFVKRKTNERRISFEHYDIDPKLDGSVKRDTLMFPPEYKGKYVVSNPPYLARNKSRNKTVFDKYGLNDLYKCFIKELTTENDCIGGIVIIPLNFWSSIRKCDTQLRYHFLTKYTVSRVNVFENSVFNDTDYTVCSFQFELKNCTECCIPFFIFPEGRVVNINFNASNNMTIGGELYSLGSTTYKISRLIGDDKSNTNILVRCLDDKGKKNIGLSMVDDKDIFSDRTPNKSARTFATLVITPAIDMTRQKKLVEDFNSFLQEKRAKYNSLFMSNYREAGRKRISFDLVYDIVAYLLEQ